MTEKLAAQLKTYRVAMSTLHDPDEPEEWQNPSTCIAEDLDVQGFVENEQEFVEDDEEDENGEDGVENLGPVQPQVFYSMRDVEELHKEWQETYRQEIVELERNTQSQLNAQAAKARAQQNLGTTVRNPTEEVVPMEHPRLSTNAPAFVPGQALGMGTTFYNSTPRPDDNQQPMGSVSTAMDRTDPVNVYTTFRNRSQFFKQDMVNTELPIP